MLWAVVNGHEACVRVLIASKADLAYADGHGLTALHYAARNGRSSICRVLVDEGASLTAVNRHGKTPLKLAKEQGKAECVAILEEAAAARTASLVREVAAEASLFNESSISAQGRDGIKSESAALSSSTKAVSTSSSSSPSAVKDSAATPHVDDLNQPAEVRNDTQSHT